MRNLSISPQESHDWRPKAANTRLAPIIPFKTFNAETVVISSALRAADAGLGVFRLDPDTNDRKLLDAVIGIAIVMLVHATVIEHFKHPPAEVVPPREEKVEITLLRPPPPPPPPPVAQPQPRPAPVKDAIPPKPKPKPKKLPPPVVEQPPVQTNAPVSNDAPTAPAPVQAAPAPAEKVVQLTSADYLRNPPPEYPVDAQDRGWEGKVLLKVRILPSGKPDVVQVQKTSGHATLDTAAIRAVKGGWMFKPNMQGATATAVWVIIPIVFQL